MGKGGNVVVDDQHEWKTTGMIGGRLGTLGMNQDELGTLGINEGRLV